MILLSDDRISLDVNVIDANDAIEKAGLCLLEAGYIEEKYIGAMKKNYADNGPYFVLAPHFAMPHARPEDGVKKSGFSLITISNPVSFGNYNDPVRVVMALATSTADEHIEYMSKVARILGRKGVINNIYTSKSKEEIMSIFS